MRSAVAAACAVVVIVASPHVSRGAAPGLVAAYSFNEGSGTTVADASGAGNTGITTNTTWTTAGRAGGALTFNGSSSWVTVNDSPSLDLRTALTLEAWVRPTTLGATYRTVVIKQQATQLIYDLYANNKSGRPTGNVYNAKDNETQGAATLPLNTWTFLADTWDGTTLRLYVNGTQVSSLAVSGTMPTSTAPLRIGGNSLWNEWFAGQIDEVRIYNRPLAPAEIQSDMNTPVAPDTTPPSAPSGLVQTASAATSVTVSWAASTDNVGVTGYDLFLNGSAAGTVTSTSATFTSLTCGSRPNIGVDARDAAGNRSTISTLVVAAAACPDTTPPSAPAGLVQTGSTASSVVVSWTGSTDDVAVTGYDTFVDGVPTGTTTATNATISALTCGIHTVGIDAFDAAGNRSSLATLVVSTTACPDISPPAVPSGLTQTGSTPTSATVAWVASVDDVGVAGYDLYLDGTFASTTTALTATFDGLACGSHTVGIDAFDAAGNRSTASTLTVSASACVDTSPPSSPSGLAQTGSTATTVTVAWIASTDDVGTIGYDLYLDGVPAGTVSDSPASLNRLQCGTLHTVGVDAYDAAGNRSAVSTVMAATSACPDTSPPSAPSGLVETGSTATSVTVSWSASSDDVGVMGYDLAVDGVAEGTTGALSATFSGLTCGAHVVGVDAYDAAGNRSSTSAIVASTTACPDMTPPSAPAGLGQTGSTSTSVTVAWTASTDNVGVTGYDLYLDGAAAGSSSASPATLGGLSCGTTHTVGVSARDAAGNHSPVTITSVSAAGCGNGTQTPTPVPTAGVYGVTVGPGFAEASAREIVRTAGNAVYVIAADDDTCQGGGSAVIRAWKGVGQQAGNPNVPTSFVEQDGADRPTSSGSGDCTYNNSSTLGAPDIRLDSIGVIHVAYVDGRNGNVYYQTFSTATDTWGSRTVIGTGASVSDGSTWPRYGQVALSLDRNDVPHVAYTTSGASNRLQYTDRVSGSWSMPVAVASGPNLMHPSMVTSLDGTLHLAWLDNSLAAHADIQYSHYVGGTWSVPEVVSAGDGAVLANGDSDQGPSIATDTNNVPYVLFLDGSVSGSNDFVRMRYRTTSGWVDDTPPGGSGGASNANASWFAHTPQNYISATNGNFVFLGHDVNIEFGYQYQLGGAGTSWGPYSTLDPRSNASPGPGDTVEPGTDGSASIRFDPLRDNNPSLVDVLYFDERDNSDASHHHATLYYKAIVIGSGSGLPPPPDTTPPTVSLSAPNGGATVSGSGVTLAATAGDNVGVVGVQFKLDGGNLGTEQTASPYAVSWNTTVVANGLHTLTAVARDAAGNTTTSSSVSVTVSNTAPPPTQIALVKDLGAATAVDSTATLGLVVPNGGVAAGDVVVIWAGMSGGGSGVTISGVADTRGNTYKVDTTIKHPSTGINTFIASAYIGTAIPAGAKITITFASAYYSLKEMVAAEFSGLSPTSWLDKTALGTGNSTSPVSAVTASTQSASELVVGGFGSENAAKFTPAPGFTALTSASTTGSGVTRSIYECYQIVSVVGAFRASGTLSTSGNWTAATATYH